MERQRLLAYARKLFPQSADNEASDVVQEALLIASQKPNPPAEPAAKEAWLFGIVKNVVRSMNRRLLRLKRDVRKTVDAEALAPLAADDTSIGERVVRGEETDRLRKALDELDPDAREIVRLHLEEGMKFVDVAERLGIGADAARMRFDRAVKRIRKLMDSG